MGEPTVLELISEKIDLLDAKVTEGFRRINGRLDKHDDSLNTVQLYGCARYGGEHPGKPSRVRQTVETGGLVAVLVAVFEALKAWAR